MKSKVFAFLALLLICWLVFLIGRLIDDYRSKARKNLLQDYDWFLQHHTNEMYKNKEN